MKKKYDYRKFKSCMVYTTKEISEILGNHIRTIQKWINKEGLEIKNPNSKPHLIEGSDIKKFLKDRSTKNTIILGKGELLCLRCKKSVKPKDGRVQFDFKEKKLGRGTRQIYIKGKCSECEGSVNRFSSTNDIIKSGFNNSVNGY